ncbi:uncharacterized protein EHS24_008253 [Apiotrichum porosum]|uniref:Amidase domain-containing protein n=1 Tax=Apiotrichum porosum TaxID=105984 RepID=A0A427XT80_9TREE|nr:uncharacterized protein EHS24_008253 [Apiotrichum porosum]RSH82049.1 hypothetical protein EHS24_008253 [Apiotrichum porosum]
MTQFDVVEASIADLRAALDAGKVTSVGLVSAYLRRIAAYDHHGIKLNSVPILSSTAFDEARASDLRRARGQTLSPLDGIPYTAKDSYKAAGMTVAAGSPAFKDLVAGEDCFVIGRLRQAGAILLGRTTMPPLANGGMQRGLDGRAESPFNAAFLTSAWASGSSNGSGTATAASFAAFGLGEETWSSGRAPASCNALCAYTPSWGVISVRGNWPLVPTMDVVVPHTRTMADMLTVLDVVVADDAESRGDFWRTQRWVDIAPSSTLRPKSYPALAARSNQTLAGVRIGLPRCYLGRNPKIPTRPSVVSLVKATTARLEALGAQVIECDLPVATAYELANPDNPKEWFQGGIADHGYVPREFFKAELEDLSAFALEDFVTATAEHPDAQGPRSFAHVDPALVFPLPVGQIQSDYGDDMEMGTYVSIVKDGVRQPADIEHVAEGIKGLARARAELLDAWMDSNGFAALALPTLADVAPADADLNPVSHALAVRNGTWVANGNLWVRHLGVPTVTVPMGLADDIGMPFGITFAGRGWDDTRLLELGAALEAASPKRPVPGRTPVLAPVPVLSSSPPAASTSAASALDLDVDVEYTNDSYVTYNIRGRAPGAITSASITINGQPADVKLDGAASFTAQGSVPAESLQSLYSAWRPPYGTMVIATVTTSDGEYGALRVMGSL